MLQAYLTPPHWAGFFLRCAARLFALSRSLGMMRAFFSGGPARRGYRTHGQHRFQILGEQQAEQKLRIMLVTLDPSRTEMLGPALQGTHCELVAVASADDDLLAAVNRDQPDVVIIDMDAPNRDTLENLRTVQAHTPRPMVMFSQDDGTESIRRAVQAGVSAYVADGLQPKRVRPILDAAIARFEQLRELESELVKTRSQLAERKLLDRAKGLIMHQRGISESEAYQLLRKSAMDRNLRLVEVAESVVAAAELLGKP